MIRSSSLPGVVGLCANDLSAIAAIVNEAQERLINDPLAPDEGWWGGWATMAFNVTVQSSGTVRHGYITAPSEVARIILMDVCKRPVRMRNGFYEYLEFGVGLQPRDTSCALGSVGQACAITQGMESYERDSVVTLNAQQTHAPCIIRFYPTSDSDLGRRILVQGTDQNGNTVYSTDVQTKQAIQGEYITLNSPFTDTENKFSVTGFIKGMTVGPVNVFEVDDGGTEYTLTVMNPGEVTPFYRRYMVNNLPPRCCNTVNGTVQVMAKVKLDFVPVISDADYLTIQSIPALIEEVQSIRYSRMDSPKSAEFEQKHHLKALQLLFGQIDHFLGRTNTAIRVPIGGSDRIRLQPK